MKNVCTPPDRLRQRAILLINCCFFWCCFFWFPALLPAQDTQPASPQPPIKTKIYHLGNISIDTATMSFSVPGKIIRTEPPLEFLAVTKGGYKSYESLIELDTDAIRFNAACLLIGIKRDRSQSAKFHFDPSPAQGERVDILVSWKEGEKEIKVPAGDLLSLQKGEKVMDYWIYTGSHIDRRGEYMADTDGTLIGFVHDPASIIEHHSGLGLNNYGAVQGNADVCPKVGHPITLTILKTATE